MPELPKLALARHIVKNFMNDDFTLIIVYGNLRIGKSTYVIKAMEQAHQYLGLLKGKMTPNYLKWIMGWDTREVVETWMLGAGKRQPCFLWDDAGFWLHSMNWNDPLMITVQQYFNVVGTDYNTMILTTPSPKWVLSKIANMPDMYRIKVTKRTGGNKDSDYMKYARVAKGYQRWESPDLKRGGVNLKLKDNFSCKMEAELYTWYKPVRESYATKAKEAIMDRLLRNQRKHEYDELKEIAKQRKLEKQVFGEYKTEVPKIEKD